MLAIMASTLDERSSPDSPNLYGKVKKTFACVVVELLAVNFLFVCWFNHSSQSLPAPYPSNILDEIYIDLTYNRELIVNYCICHEIGITGMFDFTFIILYKLSLHPINLFVFRLVPHQLVFIVFTFIQIVCLNDVVMFNLYTSNLHTFKSYVFLSSIWICLILFYQFVYFVAKSKMSLDKLRNNLGPLYHWKSFTLHWLHTRESSLRESFSCLNSMRILRCVNCYLSNCIDWNQMYQF